MAFDDSLFLNKEYLVEHFPVKQLCVFSVFSSAPNFPTPCQKWWHCSDTEDKSTALLLVTQQGKTEAQVAALYKLGMSLEHSSLNTGTQTTDPSSLLEPDPVTLAYISSTPTCVKY